MHIAYAVLLLAAGTRSVWAECTQTYTVVGGDSCTLIPQKALISSYQLTRLNPSLNCAGLFVGQSLCVKDSTYNCQPVYQVKSGDSCSSITAANSITFAELLENNPPIGANCAIQPGQMLCVAPKTPTPTCSKSYTVKSGDNCDLIATSNQISGYQLALLNPSMTCGGLQIGQILCVTSPSYSCQPVYTVKSGDGCFGIAEANGINLDKLYSNNPDLQNSCNIHIGQSLCVEGGTPTEPDPPTSTECTRKTTVQSGETCDTICERSGISRYWLGQLNPTINAECSNIVGGAAICVDSAVNTCGATYVVGGQEGGCSGIASSLGITLQTLLQLNPNVNSECTNIYIGESLCTASKPPGTPSNACTRRYTLVAGDTCTVAAGRNSLTNAQLLALNPGLSCNTMIPDNQVCSFSPSIRICPKLIQTNVGDSCFSLAQDVGMSLEEWQSINAGLSCNPLQLNYLVCSAHGNATLPEQPSGSNPTALPLCGSYDKRQYCCTQFSVSADLFNDPLCLRENGCQANCLGDPGVVKPGSSATPTLTLTPTNFPTPPPEPNQCANCTASECCTGLGVCANIKSWYCQAANGCTQRCDTGSPMGWVDPPQVPLINYTFPSGDYSQYDGNPCRVCDSSTAPIVSPSGQYCCAQNVECLPSTYDECRVGAGCLYNCFVESVDDDDECERTGICNYVRTTVLRPWASGSPFDPPLVP